MRSNCASDRRPDPPEDWRQTERDKQGLGGAIRISEHWKNSQENYATSRLKGGCGQDWPPHTFFDPLVPCGPFGLLPRAPSLQCRPAYGLPTRPAPKRRERLSRIL